MLVGWIALAVVLFHRLPAAQAVVVIFVLGELFLPEVQLTPRSPEMPAPLSYPGFKLTKGNALCYAALLSSLLLDGRHWGTFRPRWFDLPMAFWCVSPLFSSLANDLGLYDGVGQTLDQTLTWGVPYFLGRLYLGDTDGIRMLTVAIILGALLYMPFCLYEVRMSPQLHRLVYGYHQHEFLQAIRYGGYRPMVFMEHGLAVGMWMITATLIAFWLAWTGHMPSLLWLPGLRPLPMQAVAVVLLGMSVLCKSTGALVLGVVGGAALFLTRRGLSMVVLAGLLAAAPLYLAVRTSGVWSGREMVEWIGTHLDPGRAQSLDFRLKNETLLAEKALEQPVFGWGGWGRAHVHDDQDKDVSVTDGLWIIALGNRGFFGLINLYIALLLPSARLVWHHRRDLESPSALAPAVVGALLLTLYVIDSLLNAQINPVFLLAAGGLAGLADCKTPELLTEREPMRNETQQQAPRRQGPAGHRPVPERPPVRSR
jgi:hypothetical protein